MFIRKVWQQITTRGQTREIDAAAQRECALRDEFARRVHGLESQILLLRAENRALLNSVLGIAGIPPIMVAEAPKLFAPGASQISPPIESMAATSGSDVPKACVAEGDVPGMRDAATPQIDGAGSPPGEDIAPRRGASPSMIAGHSGAVPLRGQKRARGADPGRIVTPMRRRSWHQIYRMLELESTRRKANDQQDTA